MRSREVLCRVSPLLVNEKEKLQQQQQSKRGCQREKDQVHSSAQDSEEEDKQREGNNRRKEEEEDEVKDVCSESAVSSSQMQFSLSLSLFTTSFPHNNFPAERKEGKMSHDLSA